MVDVGSEANTPLFDHNNDGLLDIVIGNYGYFNAGTFNGKLALYENTGTADAPSWTLMTRNYADRDLRFQRAASHLGDINGDGKTDMLVGEENGLCITSRTLLQMVLDATFILAGQTFRASMWVNTPQLVDEWR